MTSDEEGLLAEVTYMAYHLHWPLGEILDLEHPLRERFVAEIAELNRAAREG